MARTDYTQRGSDEVERMIEDVFALGGIGYVALGSGQDVLMREAPGVASDTTPESNFYEELLVNPTLLEVAGQRGRLDCGGLNYIAIGYGDFVQLILPTRVGHISMGISRRAPAGELAAQVHEVLKHHDFDRRPPSGLLLAP